ncbi:MAG: hypothetical protein HC945_02130 [Nitrosarchaeum sp.]|nr:hypothetical protein [Nitrosarchaeum sp.]
MMDADHLVAPRPPTQELLLDLLYHGAVRNKDPEDRVGRTEQLKYIKVVDDGLYEILQHPFLRGDARMAVVNACRHFGLEDLLALGLMKRSAKLKQGDHALGVANAREFGAGLAAARKRLAKARDSCVANFYVLEDVPPSDWHLVTLPLMEPRRTDELEKPQFRERRSLALAAGDDNPVRGFRAPS